MALIIDQVVTALIGIVLVLVFLLLTAISGIATQQWDFVGGVLGMLVMILYFLLTWSYFFFFEAVNRGRTPGKMALGLRVVSVDGTALDVGQAAVRNLLRLADMFPMLVLPGLLGEVFQGMIMMLFFMIAGIPTYATGLISLVMTGTFQRLGDLAAGTLVIRQHREVAQKVFVEDDDRIRELAKELRMRAIPSNAITQGLNDFVARRRRLNPARAEEIAKSVESSMRSIFSAEELDCTALELLLAAHFQLYNMERKEMAGMEAKQNITEVVGR